MDVVLVGAIVTVNHFRFRMSAASADRLDERFRVSAASADRLDDSCVNFVALLFAKTAAGDVITGPSLGTAMVREEITSERFYRFTNENVVAHPPKGLEEHAAVYYEPWEKLSAALAEHEIDVPASRLIALPFETIIDDEVRHLLGAAGEKT